MSASKRSYKWIVFTAAFLLLLSVGWMLSLAVPGGEAPYAQANRFFVKDGQLYSINDTLGARRIVVDKDIQTLFDERGDTLLIGKGIYNRTFGRAGGTKLFVVQNDNTGLQQVTDKIVQDAFFNVSGDRVYFVEEENKDLYEADLHTNAVRLLASKVMNPKLSPDEQSLIYQKLNADWQQGDFYEKALGIVLLDLNSGKEQRISGSLEDFFPFWAPDGKHIFFYSRSPEGLASLFVINKNGVGRKQLTNIGESEVSDRTVDIPADKISWSTDKTTLLYESDNRIWINSLAPSYEKVAGTKKIGFGKDPKWSKDGNTISVVVTEATDPEKSIVNMDKEGNILK